MSFTKAKMSGIYYLINLLNIRE